MKKVPIVLLFYICALDGKEKSHKHTSWKSCNFVRCNIKNASSDGKWASAVEEIWRSKMICIRSYCGLCQAGECRNER